MKIRAVDYLLATSLCSSETTFLDGEDIRLRALPSNRPQEGSTTEVPPPYEDLAQSQAIEKIAFSDALASSGKGPPLCLNFTRLES